MDNQVKRDEMPVLCNSCDKELSYYREDGSFTSNSAFQIVIQSYFKDKNSIAHLNKNIGEYALDKVYNLCYSCYLKSLNIKP